MSGIVGSRLNSRGSGIVGNLGTDGQILLSSGAGTSAVFETVSAGGDISFGGDTFGADKVIGANDSYTLSLETNNTTAMTINTDGSINSPVQPTFFCKHRTHQLNMDADADTTITWSEEIFDIGSNFASNTFTAPVTGKYLLTSQWIVAQLDHDDDAYVNVGIDCSNRKHSWSFSIQDIFDDDLVWQEWWSFPISCVVDMDASDTAIVTYLASGSGAAQADVYSVHPYNAHFTGCLVA